MNYPLTTTVTALLKAALSQEYFKYLENCTHMRDSMLLALEHFAGLGKNGIVEILLEEVLAGNAYKPLDGDVIEDLIEKVFDAIFEQPHPDISNLLDHDDLDELKQDERDRALSIVQDAIDEVDRDNYELAIAVKPVIDEHVFDLVFNNLYGFKKIPQSRYFVSTAKMTDAYKAFRIQ